MNNNYDELETQIGSMGGDQNPEISEPTLGKLQHKQSYGQKEDLSADEEKSLETFLAKGNKKRQIAHEEINVGDGWIPIDREEMGIRSIFYPAEWEFFIHAATVQAIKNWTAIDEERFDQVNRVFNEIIKSCVKIDTHSPVGAGWAQINSWDRFWFVLKVREYTFSTGETKIEFTDACSECESDITYELTSNALFYEFPDEDLVEKYWVDGVWVIDPREYDVDAEPITLYTPKLGKDEAIIEWGLARARAKQKLDETFIEFLPWLLNKPSRDEQMLDRQIQKIYNEYKSWDVDMFSFMKDVIKNITINPSEKLRTICPHCGQEATSEVQFPNGIKALFCIKSKAKKFGSR